MSVEPHEYILRDCNVSTLSYAQLLAHCTGGTVGEKKEFNALQPLKVEKDLGLFAIKSAMMGIIKIAVTQTYHSVILSCTCKLGKGRLCEHQFQILCNIMDRDYLRIFFDSNLRLKKIYEIAKDYGLEKETNLETFFEVVYVDKSIEVKPKIKGLMPLNSETQNYLNQHLIPKNTKPTLAVASVKKILVFKTNKYYDGFSIAVFEGPITKDGKIKNPLLPIDPLSLIWKTEKVEEAKFYTGISQHQNNLGTETNEIDIEGFKSMVKNPLGLDIFCHDNNVSENIKANTLSQVYLQMPRIEINLLADLKEPFYEVSGELVMCDKSYELKSLIIKYGCFIKDGDTLSLITNLNLLRVINFFKNNNEKILIHPSKFDEFKEDILSKLEGIVHIKYAYIKQATSKQLKEQLFDEVKEKIIYLSDEITHVFITPVMRYGNIEVPVFSRKQIYDTDQNGNVFSVERDQRMELQFTTTLVRQHPLFKEQLEEGEYFYLHKDKFLDNDWFLDVFEAWRREGIIILGFNELKNNKLNAHKPAIKVNVNSGIDWFNAALSVQFGKQKASLRQIHKAVRNKSKFVVLDDGTKGILPDEWIKKIAGYFQFGELVKDLIMIPKSNFEEINQLFEQAEINDEVKRELAVFSTKLANFESIEEVPVPKELNASLRDYQKQGLNWLNFLDEFNFGACLADDMGLGKTIQIIAFILSQRAKIEQNTNLVVVPTSLLFNWQEEIAKFAPSIKILTNYGLNRLKDTKTFKEYEVVLTTYGMLLSDIVFLKKYRFNYVFLDESQAIKSPSSQRYMAAKLLQARNRVVLTGTPIENNTFDLYGQLSFACPGLLGSKQYFKDTYSTPIDSFEDSKRAVLLQKKISPFVLRRTKRQVVNELPDKTEMVVYCEMGADQRKVYDLYEKELRDFIAGKEEEELPKNSIHVLAGLTKLRQICNAPALLKDEEFQGDSSAKIEVLLEQIENKIHQHKILVFSQFVSMLRLIKKELETKKIRFEYLTGQTKNRAASVSEFQNNKQVRVFLISLKAGGTGLNLTEADYVYLVDPWWNPAVENQAIDRSYRIGQKKNVIAVRLICPNTVEEKIMKIQASKTTLANDLIKTDASMVKDIGKAKLLEMLG